MIELHAALDYNTEPALGWQEVVVNTPRILLVEDDENVAFVTRELPDKIDRALQQWQLKRAVARAESRYRSIFDEASDGILVCDINGVVLEANQHACRWLQLERPALVGQRIQDLEQPAHPLVRAEVAERLNRAGEAVYEAFFRRADGTNFPVEVSVQRVVHT